MSDRIGAGGSKREDELLATLKVLRNQIAQHCASFFWNDVDVGLLHANWRDVANNAIVKAENK